MATVGQPTRGGGGGGRGGGGGGRGGGQGGGPPRGGGEGGQRRGSWRGGPPGSGGHNAARDGSPVGGPQPGAANGPNTPRVSINDHMSEMKKIQVEKPAINKVLQTDTEIAGPARSSPAPRELQPWAAPDNMPNGNGTNGASTPKPRGGAAKDNETFGADDKSGKWDQFATNARLFGTTTSYQEEIYTTRLDKGGSDFKAKEREAERLAREIMGQSSSNMHIMDERNVVTDWADLKDDEEKYSGVQRDQAPPQPPTQRGPNAYVPPAARKSQAGPGGYAAAAGKGVPTPPAGVPGGKPNGNGSKAATPAGPTPAKSPAPLSTPSVPPATSTSPVPPTAAKVDAKAPAVDGAKDAAAPAAAGSSPLPPSAASVASPSAPAPIDLKDGLGQAVSAYRQFVGDEKEKVEAKKQSLAKTERDRQLADLKSFQANFKVPLPIPKDILPILSKDEDKQKSIEKNAQVSLQAAKDAKFKSPTPNSTKLAGGAPADMARAVSSAAKPTSTPGGPAKKIAMHIAEIPAFKSGARKPSFNTAMGSLVVPIPITESAKADIPSSPTLSATASQTAEAAKLNPKAAAFVFKPTAAAFKPGQSSAAASPASRPSLPSALAGPSQPRNAFFGDAIPGRVTVDLRADFNPFRHGNVPQASLVPPNWPYTGRPVQMTFMQPGHGPPMGFGGMEEDGSGMASPQFRQPGLGPMQGWGYPPNHRFGQQPGMPQQAGMPNPMFSPVGPGYIPLPGMPPHMIPGAGGGGPQHQQQQQQHPQHAQHPQHPQHAQHQQHLHQQQMMQRQQQEQGGPGGPGGPGQGGQGQGGQGGHPHQQHQQHPSGMPLYFQNGLPQNPQFLPQHMQQFNPNNPNGPGMPHSPQQRPGLPGGPQLQPGQPGQGPQGQGQGHGQGQPGQQPGQGQGQGMYYTQGQLPTPHHTPQNQPQHVLPFPPPGSANQPHSQQFQNSPMIPPGMPQGPQGGQQGQGRPPSTGYEQHHPQQQQPGGQGGQGGGQGGGQ